MKRFFAILILLLVLVFLYAKYVEPTSLEINEYLITNSSIPSGFNGFKIAHFSDILYKNSEDYIIFENVIQKIKQTNSDIIVFTGDLLKKKINKDEQEKLATVLSELQPNLYKYAILGDYDSDQTKEILEASNFIILDNSSTYLFNKDNEPLLIAGGENITEEPNVIDENITYNYKIALTHKPDNYDNLKNNYDLVLAGHSLGGEIRLPFYGATIKKIGAKKYTDKMYNYENSYLYISSGIGTEKTGLRFLNKPSINIYRLYNK